MRSIFAAALLFLGVWLPIVASAQPCVGSGCWSPVVVTIASSGASQVLKPNVIGDSIYKVTLTGNTAFAIGTGAAGIEQTIRVYLTQDATAGRVPTFGTNVSWQSNVAPTFNSSAGSYDIVQFTTVNGGTTYAGLPVALGVAAPTVPGMETGPVATAGNTQNVLTANMMTAFPSVSGYNLYRGTSAGGESGTPLVSGLSSPAYNDTSLTNGTAYYYQWAAVNSQGIGPFSAEVSATPSTTAYGHNAVFGTALPRYIYTSYNSGFEAGANPFSYRALVSPASATPAAYQVLVGMWNANTVSTFGESVFGLNPAGTLNGSFINTSNATFSCNSTVNPGFVTSVPLWVRVDVTPTTGTCTFYTAPAGSAIWSQLGAVVVSANGSAVAVTTNTANTEPIIGDAYGNANYYSGAIYAAQYWINGVLKYSPVAGASGMTDATGWTWVTSPAGVTFN